MLIFHGKIGKILEPIKIARCVARIPSVLFAEYIHLEIISKTTIQPDIGKSFIPSISSLGKLYYLSPDD